MFLNVQGKGETLSYHFQQLNDSNDVSEMLGFLFLILKKVFAHE